MCSFIFKRYGGIDIFRGDIRCTDEDWELLSGNILGTKHFISRTIVPRVPEGSAFTQKRPGDHFLPRRRCVSNAIRLPVFVESKRQRLAPGLEADANP